MTTFRSRSEGRGSHREAHPPPPWSAGRSGTFRQQSDSKASNSQLAQPQRPVGRCCPGRSGSQDSQQVPYPRTVRDEPAEHPWPGPPFGGEALAVFQPEIAASDGNPRRRDVALDQLGHPPHLHATNGRTASKTTRTQRGSRARWRSFTSPLAITTSKASPVQRYHTGTVWALPSLR
jgi:hypothetical protein